MATLHHVKKARKAIPEAGIEVGQSYFYYKKRVNGKGSPRVCSRIKPRRSAYATSSPFIGALMNMEDDLGVLIANNATAEQVVTWLEAAAEAVEALGDECRDKAASVEAGMKHGAGATSAGMLLARADHCSDLAAALREASGELSNADVLSEDVDEDSLPQVSVAEVLGNLVWLPAVN